MIRCVGLRWVAAFAFYQSSSLRHAHARTRLQGIVLLDEDSYTYNVKIGNRFLWEVNEEGNAKLPGLETDPSTLLILLARPLMLVSGSTLVFQLLYAAAISGV